MNVTHESPTIAGYNYGHADVARSPVSLEELEKLKETVGFTGEDQRYLALAGQVLADQAEAMVDAWRARIGSQEHLARWFYGPDGKPDERYKAAVKPRFVQWVIDTCNRPFDQAWLDYQEEIALRHTPEKKNRTDNARTPDLVPLRYLLSFTSVIITTGRDFLMKGRHSPGDIERMHAAWTKAVLLSATLWSRPYTKEGLW
jgi:Protoglobin